MKKVPTFGNPWVTVAVFVGQIVVEKLIEIYLLPKIIKEWTMSKVICNPKFEKDQSELTMVLIKRIIDFIGDLIKGGK